MTTESLVSDVMVAELTRQLNDTGIVCLTDAVPAGWLRRAQQFVTDHIDQHGDRDFFHVGPGDGESILVGELFSQSTFGALLEALAAQGVPRLTAPTPVASCLRVLAGQEREDTPLMHYDDDVITILVPIFIPRGDRGRSGELIAFPNRRPFRRLLAVNIVDKLISRTARHRSRAVDVAMGDADRHVVDMVPGHAYAFWGYRTYHGNMPCAPGLVRATLILQSGEAHPNSPVMRIIARRRERLITEWVRRMHAVPPR